MGCLPKGTASSHGFAVVPNEVIDRLLGSKHSADGLALMVYLRRHLAGQAGAIHLTGPFAQTNICRDLGWGPTNLPRLKRAAEALKTAGVLTTSIIDNNTVVYSVAMPLGKPFDRSTRITGAVDLSDTGPKDSAGPGLEEFAESTRTRIRKNKTIKKQNNHHLAGQPDSHRAAPEADDDDLMQLLNLYRTTIRPAIPSRHSVAFAEQYAANGRPYEMVKTAIDTIASHPKLLKDTNSINAVWHVTHMLAAAKPFEAKLQYWLSEISRRPFADVNDELHQAALDSQMDPAVFIAYCKSKVGIWNTQHGVESCSQAENLTAQHLGQHPGHSALEPHPADNQPGKAVKASDTISNGQNEEVSRQPSILNSSSLSQRPKHIKSATLTAADEPQKLPSSAATAVDARLLLQARTKEQLLQLINEQYNALPESTDRQAVRIMKEFAELERSTFQVLQQAIKLRFLRTAKAA